MDTEFTPLPDLSACAREPIHVPGQIQPHGVLIATSPENGMVSHVSANLETSTGLRAGSVLGRPIDLLLGAAAAAAVAGALGCERYAPSNVLHLKLPIPLRPERKVVVHRHLDRVFLELEDAPCGDGGMASLSRAQGIIAGLRRAATVTRLCEDVVREVRLLTGYDRVMVYRFDAEGHGTIVAEDKAAGLEPLLHLRYPASDIPEQARRLYVLQRVRSIPDVGYAPVPLLALPQDPTALDMTYCSLRGVSPVHCEYLRNMGVAATLAVSLLHDDVLWGMIVCHHGVPHAPSPETRALCDVIGQLMSVLLLKVSQSEDLAETLRRQQAIATLREEIEAAGSVAAGLLRDERAVLDLVGAAGAMIRCGGRTQLIGQTPPVADALELAAALRQRHGEAVTALDDAGLPDAIAAGCAESASGLMLLPMSNHPGDAILWFRPEAVRTVRWGGDPRKAVTVSAATGRIAPRTSFAAWAELLRGRADPWSEADLSAARDLRRMITGSLLRQAEAQLAQLSAYDPLTGLANRRTLEQRMDRWQMQDRPGPSAMLFLDLDRFKTINDSLGHAAGDEILTQLAARVRDAAPPGSVATRLGGDEFVVFWPGAGQPEAETLAAALVRALAEPFILQGSPHHATASIGVACAGTAGGDTLMREADAAMYAAKRRGGGRAVVFEPTLHDEALAAMQTEQGLFRALENQELEVHYQPLVSVPDRTVRGFEALVRWNHPERGWVPPANFIPRAEETGLIIRIGAWVLARAIQQAGLWRARRPGVTVSVNVSARQLTEGSLSVLLARLLADEGVPAAAICLEVTESALMHEAAVRELHALREVGVAVAVDDFGTGYSSLAYLRGLPVDVVKIDRSFVMPLGSGGQADRFFRAIVDLAHTLDLKTVAEGCETEAQWQAIAASGCTTVQGWLIARAMPPGEAGALLP